MSARKHEVKHKAGWLKACSIPVGIPIAADGLKSVDQHSQTSAACIFQRFALGCDGAYLRSWLVLLFVPLRY